MRLGRKDRRSSGCGHRGGRHLNQGSAGPYSFADLRLPKGGSGVPKKTQYTIRERSRDCREIKPCGHDAVGECDPLSLPVPGRSYGPGQRSIPPRATVTMRLPGPAGPEIAGRDHHGDSASETPEGRSFTQVGRALGMGLGTRIENLMGLVRASESGHISEDCRSLQAQNFRHGMSPPPGPAGERLREPQNDEVTT